MKEYTVYAGYPIEYMAKSTEKLTETTELTGAADVLSELLSSLHIGSSLLLRDTYAPPWKVKIPNGKDFARLLDKRIDCKLVVFHLVEHGRCEIETESGLKMQLNKGDMALCFGAEAHHIFCGKGAKAQAIESLLRDDSKVFIPTKPAQGDETSLLCGAFFLSNTQFNPLIAALPNVMSSTIYSEVETDGLSVAKTSFATPRAYGAADLIAQELSRRASGSEYIIARLLEVLCAEILRSHIETVSQQNSNWFGGLKDPLISKLLSVIHAHPGHDWSVEKLATLVSISPSRCAARFNQVVGIPIMSYVAQWRMNLACRQLKESKRSAEQIANELGYQSIAAFNRAFKRQVGLPPAQWRKQQA
jgi:AraC-like DNA-binding protein